MYSAFAVLTRENMLVGSSAPLHDGAMRYYQEISLIQ